MRRDLDALAGQSFDVAVVGGGIHGAWIALRAAEAGHRVALIERDDFGSGTSSNSLKVLHGGLRYLQHLDFGRMRSSTAARREYARRFPHLFQPLPCVMPLDKGGLRSPWFLGPALMLNDIVASDRNSRVSPAARLPRGGLLGADVCRREMGMLASRAGMGARWWDGIARDTSRLVIEVVQAAAAVGAQVVNHVGVERILHAAGRVHGLLVRDHLLGREFEVRASRVVNAAGPWASGLAQASGLSTQGLPAGWVGGMNLVLKRQLGHCAAVALSTPAEVDAASVVKRRARELFFVPWRSRTMIGTDYRAVASVEESALGPPPGMAAAFLDQAARLAPGVALRGEDVALVHWGLLPVAEPGSVQPAKAPLLLQDPQHTGAQGLVTIVPEKFTSAPVVSQRVLEALRLPTAVPSPSSSPPRAPGSVAEESPASLEQRLKVALDSEMAHTLADLLRRVQLLDTGHPGSEALQACARWAVESASWNADDVARQVAQIDAWFERNLAGLVDPRPGAVA